MDINLSIQQILNCAGEVAGSCHGGSASGTYEFIKDHQGFVPFLTCMPYQACSHESDEGICGLEEMDWSCSAINTCRTCSTFEKNGGFCSEINHFPNATIGEYATMTPLDSDEMLAEIYTRGPIACSINAGPTHNYTGGIMDFPDEDKGCTHVVSITGFGTDEETGKDFWIIRNSWGEYWGEMGNFRIVRGENQLGIESNCAWATPASWTETNFGCFEDGSNCVGEYTDPSLLLPVA